MTRTVYFVTPAPGYYGDRAIVLSSHRTLDAAQRAAGPGRAIWHGGMRKGYEWLRVYEQHFQRVDRVRSDAGALVPRRFRA